MSTASTRSAYLLGLRDGAPFLLVVGPFSLLFGVVAAEAGLKVLEALAFSIVVIAGASQFAALQLMRDDAATWIVLATALAVNLRMAMYSASLTPWLGAAPVWKRAVVAYFLVDQSYACSIARFEENPHWSLPVRLAYYAGSISLVCPSWYVLTVIGALIGTAVPDWLALDFAVPICFLAILAPMLRTVAHVAAALTSIVAALAFSAFPAGTGLLFAGLVAMMVGAGVETLMDRRLTERET